MFRHYLKMAIRNQNKNKLFSVINLLGLSIGLSVSLLIINYVSYKLSFDKFHAKSERIYRVESQFYEGENLTDDWATSSFGYGSAINSEMTDIEDFVRIGVHNTEQTVAYKEKRNLESGIAFTSRSFFNVFDFKLQRGNMEEQLKRPNTVIITEDVANRYFKDKNPLGEILSFASGTNFYECEITGVLENFPANSHVNFNYLISYETLPDWIKEFWYYHEAYTYLLLEPGKNPKDIEKQFPQMAEKYKTHEALKNKTWAVSLVPLKDIHLNPQKQYEREVKGNKKSLITLTIIAIVILLTAWINYVNLTTSRSLERAKDVGVRKVSGALRLQLIKQFMMESWLVNLVSILLAIILLIVLKPLFNQLFGINLGLYILKEPLFWVSSIAILALGILASGFYPAFVMSKIKPSVILKGNFVNTGSAGTMRQALVIFQFAASLFLIYGTFIVFQQVKYMQKQNLGFNIGQTIVLKYPVSRNNLDEQVKMFAERMEESPFVSSATIAGSVPGMEVATFASNRLQGDQSENHRLYEMLAVDDHFVETFDFELLAGRSFKEGFGNDHENLLINESALNTLGFTNPEEAIGKKVILEGDANPVTIIGVVKNWHQRGLANVHTPIMFIQNGRVGWIRPKYIAIKTAGANYGETLSLIENEWRTSFPESSFKYFFLDQFFNNQYITDRRFGKTVSIFTALAFFISILGLWALAAYTASKKVKEMGVRKVLGAQIGNIIFQFSKEIIFLIIIALLIATPVSFFAMTKWLSNYAFHTDIKLWIYFAGGITTLAIAMLTITWQSWRTANRNPVEALRYE